MNTDLIPSYDMLGLPAPAWLIQTLMALTLALHWLFLGAVVGGVIVVAVNHMARQKTSLDIVNRAMTPFFSFCLSMAMTMGIAPLLFVQVLYGQFFYTSNILLGFWWLAIVPLVIAAFYVLWTIRILHIKKKSAGWLHIVVAGIFVVVASILSSNATLAQTPEAWETIWSRGANSLYEGDGTLPVRLPFALAGLVAIGGIFSAMISMSGFVKDEEAKKLGTRRGMTIATAALAVQAAFGLWLLFGTLPAGLRQGLFAGPEKIFPILAIILFAATLALTIPARTASSMTKIVLPAATYFLGLLALAAARDAVRRVALAPFFKISSASTNIQWDSFLLFLITFIAGLGVIAWLIKLARTPKTASSD